MKQILGGGGQGVSTVSKTFILCIPVGYCENIKCQNGMRFRNFLPIFIAGEAVGKPCKVPYQKGGFKVEGLPDQLIFKKPYHYGALQRRNIMLAEKTIKFILESEEYGSIPVADEPVRQLLTKIAGANAAECSLRRESPQKIEESDVEVINLELLEEEKILLYSRCKPNFTEDAWVAVGKNMKHSQEEKPLILPVYTEAEERFWLLLLALIAACPQASSTLFLT